MDLVTEIHPQRTSQVYLGLFVRGQSGFVGFGNYRLICNCWEIIIMALMIAT